MNDTQRRIEQAFSLRDPQKESLDILAQILEKIDLSKDARGTPRVRRMAEYLGQSYFDYLSGLTSATALKPSCFAIINSSCNIFPKLSCLPLGNLAEFI